MKIPVYSSTIRRKEMDAVLTCMVDEKVGPGEMNTKLNQLVCEQFGVSSAFSFRSASIALLYALEALGIEKGTGIIISALAPAWQFKSLIKAGFLPIVTDVDPDTTLMSKDLIQKSIEKGGRVLVLHETLGSIPNFEELLSLQIPVIEDISQSTGSTIDEQFVGTFGVLSILGLEEHDVLTAGGGAVLLTKEKRDAIVVQKLASLAPTTDLLPDINAALAFVQLKELKRNILLRQEMKSVLVQAVMQGRHKTLPINDTINSSVYYFPVILSSGYKEVKQYVNRKNVEIELAFDTAVVNLLDEEYDDCVHAKSLALRCVLFPLYPRLGTAKLSKIAKLLGTLP